MIKLFNTKYKSKLERKAAVLAAQELLSFETDPKSQNQIIKYCVSVLNEQKNKYLLKGKRNNKRNTNKQIEDESEKPILQVDE